MEFVAVTAYLAAKLADRQSGQKSLMLDLIIFTFNVLDKFGSALRVCGYIVALKL